MVCSLLVASWEVLDLVVCSLPLAWTISRRSWRWGGGVGGAGVAVPREGLQGLLSGQGSTAFCVQILSVVDVPAFLQVEFQQSKPYLSVKVLQIQFIGRVLQPPVVLRRRAPTVQTVQKTVEIPQVLFLGKFVDAPVVVQRLVLGSRQCCYRGSAAVAVYRQACRRCYDHAAGGFQLSVLTVEDPQIHSSTSSRYGGMAAFEGVWRLRRFFFFRTPSVDVSAHFQPSMANSSWLSRAPGVPESPRVLLPGDSAPVSFRVCMPIDS